MYQEVHIWQSQNAGTVIEGLQSDVDNNLSFISASKRLFENYVDYIGSDVSWPDLEKDLLLTMGRSRRGDQHYGREERLERYSQMAKWLPLYTEYDWFNKAIEQEVRGLEDSQDGILAKFTIFKDQYWWKEDAAKEDTHWFKFQEAVKEHQALALGPVNKRCKTMGIDIRLL